MDVYVHASVPLLYSDREGFVVFFKLIVVVYFGLFRVIEGNRASQDKERRGGERESRSSKDAEERKDIGSTENEKLARAEKWC